MYGKDFSKATVEFQEAIKINLYYAEAYFNLGLAILKSFNANSHALPAPKQLIHSRDSFKRALMIDADYGVSPFDMGIKALESTQLNKALEYFEMVFTKVRERKRADQANYFMRFVVVGDSITDETLDSRIQYLENETTKNPSYVDLHAELAQCYLEQARKSWRKGVEQYRKTLELNPGFGSARRCLDQAERQYGDLCNSFEKIISKS